MVGARDTKVMGGTSIFVSAAREALKKWKFVPRVLESQGTLEFRGRAFEAGTR